MSDSQRAELGAFLRARRAHLTPRDVGLPGDMEPGRRRTPDLRREEVAELAGMARLRHAAVQGDVVKPGRGAPSEFEKRDHVRT